MTAAAPTLAPAREGRRLRRRHLWLVPGLAIAFYANAEAQRHGLGIAPLLAFGILPHLPALGGLRALYLFKAMHHPVVPVAAVALAVIGLLPPFGFIGGLAWLSHIVIDWALGDGVRTEGGRRLGPGALLDGHGCRRSAVAAPAGDKAPQRRDTRRIRAGSVRVGRRAIDPVAGRWLTEHGCPLEAASVMVASS